MKRLMKHSHSGGKTRCHDTTYRALFGRATKPIVSRYKSPPNLEVFPRLKYSEPDLEVVVGANIGCPTSFWTYSAVMAHRSSKIDDMLAHQKENKGGKYKIKFPNISPVLWQRLNFIEDFVLDDMEIEEAFGLAMFAYENNFQHCKGQCDEVIFDLFDNALPGVGCLDKLVDALILSDNACLSKAKKIGKALIKGGRFMFKAEHIKKLSRHISIVAWTEEKIENLEKVVEAWVDIDDDGEESASEDSSPGRLGIVPNESKSQSRGL